LKPVKIIICCFICLFATGSVPGRAGQEQPVSLLRSTASGRKSLHLVVYNSNIALVSERRLVPKTAGEFRLSFADVGEKIIPSSVVVETDKGLTVLEQQYEYDLLSKQKLLESYLGRELTLERLDERTNTPTRVTGKLLSLKGGTIIQFEDHVEVDPKGTFILPEVPANLVTHPTLTWLMSSEKKGDCLLNVSYLTGGINWNCEYVLTLEGDSDRASLAGWVTVHNNSGVAYDNAELHLVAGELHRVREAGVVREQMAEMRAAAPQLAAAKGRGGDFTQEKGFEYYRYSLGRVTSLPNRQMKQIELFRHDGLKLSRVYRFEGGRQFYYSPVPGPSRPQQLNVYLEWENAQPNYPGMPLPGGIVRIYEQSRPNVAWLLGEDRISHTPRDEKVSIKAGTAFDLLGQKKQTEFKRLSDRLRQVSIEIILTNRKSKDVTVQVDEILPGDWKITSQSHQFEKLEANRIRFTTRVPAGGKVTVGYTAQFL